MVRLNAWSLRVLAVGAAVALTLAACGGSPGASTGGSSAPSGGPHVGGTIYILDDHPDFDTGTDPQRAYVGEDLAFFSGTIYRSLTAYTFSSDDLKAAVLAPDLATDLGTSSADAKTWTFTLRDGVTFQDGSPITCKDIKYGASRTFATDVINGGPTYAIQYLAIPFQADGQTSQYPGPYKATAHQQALFDKAIDCSADGKTLTFHLNQPVPDFAYTLTLGWSPVPKAADTGETYGTPEHLPVASGPYMIQSYATGNGGKFVLVRNPKWSQASDSYHHPYPDKWEVDFGLDPKISNQRMIANSGNDQTAVSQTNVQPENLTKVFKDQKTPNDAFAGRAFSSFDIYSIYLWVDVNKIPNVKIRQAMAVALNRDAMRKNRGGLFYGDFADGVIKPNIGPDYAPTGMWTHMFGKAIPDTGDPELAKKLIAESGEAAPSLTYDYRGGATGDREAAIIKASLELAGFKIAVKPIPTHYYSTIAGDAADDFGYDGWGADWPNAKTVIGPIFTKKGGDDHSKLDDPAFNAAVDKAAAETDRASQEKQWQDLNKLAMQNVYVIPTFFGLQQRLVGTKIANAYFWGPYGSWAYGDMYVLP